MNTAKAIPAFILAFGLALGMAGLTHAQQAGSDAERSAPGGIGVVKITSVTASVEAVDEKNRVVTLKGPEGNVFSVPVSDEVENLDKVKAGDAVDIDYLQSVAVDVKKSEGLPTITETEEDAAQAEAGELPGGVALRKVRVITDVLDVNEDEQSVLVRGPLGHLTEVEVRDPKVLSSLEEGDQVDLTYIEGVAISMRAGGDRG